MERFNTDEVYRSLIKLNQDLFSKGDVEAAYHILACVLHYAHALKNEQYLLDVHQLATHQLAMLDKESPAHPLSSQSSATHGRVNVYHMLAAQAKTISTLIARESRIATKLDNLRGPKQ